MKSALIASFNAGTINCADCFKLLNILGDSIRKDTATKEDKELHILVDNKYSELRPKDTQKYDRWYKLPVAASCWKGDAKSKELHL